MSEQKGARPSPASTAMPQQYMSARAASEASPQPTAVPSQHPRSTLQSPSDWLNTEYRALVNSRAALSSALSGLDSRHLDVKLMRWNLQEAMGELEAALTIRDLWTFPPNDMGSETKGSTNDSGMGQKVRRASWEQGKGHREGEDEISALDAKHDTQDAPKEDAREVFSVSDGCSLLTPTISDMSAGTVRVDESEKDGKAMHEWEKRDPSTANVQMESSSTTTR